jgi:NADH dehydrogenase
MHLEPGDSLFHAGEPAQSLYAVKKGNVNITDAQGQLVNSAGPGEHFGERALLSDGIWRFDATATESSELVAIDGETFKTLAKSIGSLDALFRSTAQQYHLPEEIQNTVDMIPEATRKACAADVMTRNIAFLDAGVTVQDAVAEFQAHPHSTYPVTADGCVIGLLRRSVAYEWLKNHGLTCVDKLQKLPLTKPFCVTADTPVPVLVGTLMRSGVSKAVVVDEQKHLLGMITLFDLLKGTQNV